MPYIDEIKAGDTVIRLMAGIVKMRLQVTHVDADLIHCSTLDGAVSGWTFCRRTGVEVSHDLRSGPQYSIPRSRLTHLMPTTSSC